jgi:hypothetical protein
MTVLQPVTISSVCEFNKPKIVDCFLNNGLENLDIINVTVTDKIKVVSATHVNSGEYTNIKHKHPIIVRTPETSDVSEDDTA